LLLVLLLLLLLFNRAWHQKFRKQVHQHEVGLGHDADLPTIDVMISCYSEPTEIVEMTLRACYEMDYPADKITCWVCDDGNKAAMKDMCTSVGQVGSAKGMETRYVARVKVPVSQPVSRQCAAITTILLQVATTHRSSIVEFLSFCALLKLAQQVIVL
jgi:cellulose synthase/poly-beta-1,6-N-acetylglucosamine synthase-like glycosyltransferase